MRRGSLAREIFGFAQFAKAQAGYCPGATEDTTRQPVRIGYPLLGKFKEIEKRGVYRVIFIGADQDADVQNVAFAFVERALTPPQTVEVWFDFSSPFAYLASTQLRAFAGRTGAVLELKPLLLGALFKSIGTANVPMLEMSAPKREYMALELQRWAERWGVPFKFASRFPMNTVKALRLTMLAPKEKKLELVLAIYRAYWAEDRDSSDEAELASIARSVGIEPEPLLARLGDDATKALLRVATETAQSRGVFGVPTFFVGNDRYWGQDRLEEVERRLCAPHEDA